MKGMEPIMDENTPQPAADDEILALAESIFEEEYRRYTREDPIVGSITRLFGVPYRQALAAIERSQHNVLDVMIKRGFVAPDAEVTTTEVGLWAEKYLTYDQRLSILAFHVGSQVQLDWLHRRNPETGAPKPDPDYMI